MFKTFLKKTCLSLLRRFIWYRKLSHIPLGELKGIEMSGGQLFCKKEYQSIRRPMPGTIDPEVYWKFKALLIDKPSVTFIIRANNWRIWGNQGAVITDQGYVLKAVSREFEKPDHSIFKQVKLVAPKTISGKSVVLAASGGNMYYHWMFDILPRLHLLRECNIIKDFSNFVIPFQDLPFQRESLQLLHVDLDKVLAANDHFSFHIIADELFVPALPSPLDVVAPWACSFLRKTFLIDLSNVRKGRKLYLKRNDKRKIVNEMEIAMFLAEHHFETIDCAGLTIAEQARLFYEADVITGPHGAAFTNVVFCREGTKVIEFFSPRWINPCYWTICAEQSLMYFYLVGEGPPPDNTSDAKGTTEDITLSTVKLKALFDRFNILAL